MRTLSTSRGPPRSSTRPTPSLTPPSCGRAEVGRRPPAGRELAVDRAGAPDRGSPRRRRRAGRSRPTRCTGRTRSGRVVRSRRAVLSLVDRPTRNASTVAITSAPTMPSRTSPRSPLAARRARSLPRSSVVGGAGSYALGRRRGGSRPGGGPRARSPGRGAGDRGTTCSRDWAGRRVGRRPRRTAGACGRCRRPCASGVAWLRGGVPRMRSQVVSTSRDDTGADLAGPQQPAVLGRRGTQPVDVCTGPAARQTGVEELAERLDVELLVAPAGRPASPAGRRATVRW